ncbi:hypothetical protein PFISCL1PPCAC_21316, partial [Pristionchus fissidentatus]
IQMSSTPDIVIRMDIDHVLELSEEGIFSDIHYAKNLPWKLLVKTEQREDKTLLAAYLFCNDECETPGWSCDVSIDTVVINSNAADNRQNKIYLSMFRKGFFLGMIRCMIYFFLFFPKLQGFIKDDRVTIEARVFVKKTTGVRKPKSADYTTPQEGHNNVILVVDGKKLH